MTSGQCTGTGIRPIRIEDNVHILPGSAAQSGPWIDFQYRNEAVTRKIQAVQAEIFQEFTLTHPERALSRYVSYKIRCEEQRLGNGGFGLRGPAAGFGLETGPDPVAGCGRHFLYRSSAKATACATSRILWDPSVAMIGPIRLLGTVWM